MGIFSKSERTTFPVTINVVARDAQDASKAAEALAKVASKFTPDQLLKLSQKLNNPLVVAQLKAFI